MDIDMDFGDKEREKVISYIKEKYGDCAAQIATYGVYKAKNLINDLAKVYSVPSNELNEIKKILEDLTKGVKLVELDYLLENKTIEEAEERYTGIITHFSKLYGQVRFVGKHAAGIAISTENLNKRVGLMRLRGELQTSYDLDDLEYLGILKMDILGVATVNVISKLEKTTGTKFNYELLKDPKIYKNFQEGKTEGIFQLEKKMAKKILEEMECDSFSDVVAASALNRPAPLKLGVLDDYVNAKLGGSGNSNKRYYEYCSETYGVVIFQEQVMKICRGLANMEWSDIDSLIKGLSKGKFDPELKVKFVEGSKNYSKMKKKESEELFDRMAKYLFNKGHATAYSIITAYMMYFKVYYPLEFWCEVLNAEKDDKKTKIYKAVAVVEDNCYFMPPNINGPVGYTVVNYQGEKFIQEGLKSIKGIGDKALEEISKNQPYNDHWEVEEKCVKRQVNAKVLLALKNAEAMDTNGKTLKNRIILHNQRISRSWYNGIGIH